MSDKTLVERLHDQYNDGCVYITQCNLARAVGIKCCMEMQAYGCLVCLDAITKAIIDSIEREYLPRPRFEDGEFVQIGDTIDGSCGDKVLSYSVRSDGKTIFNTSTVTVAIDTGECVRRPDTDVLDADGVPIEVGDTVYFVLDPEPLRVVAIDNYGFIICEGKKDSTFPHPDVLTHKQPDSLERIKKDAGKSTFDYWGCAGMPCRDCPAEVDGKNPRDRYGAGMCQTAMKLDLLRRQREVLERER